VELTASDCFVDPDVAVARSLPSASFTEPSFLDLELSTIFGRHWLLAPQRTAAELRVDSRSLGELVRLRGSMAPLSLLDQPLFLLRDWEDRLHCFPNVCTHAWYPLVHGPGREKTLVCRQHGRKFDCAGHYLSQPGFASPGVPQVDDLCELPVEEWGQLLFVALGKPERPFATVFAEVQESLRCLALETCRRAPQEAEERIVDGNWKQHAWNYMDTFHLPFIHRAPGGLVDALDMSSYVTELYPSTALQWAYARDPAHGFDPDLLPPRFSHPTKRVFALWWFVFPNLTLNFYPWGLSVNVYAPVPGCPNRTRFFWYQFVLDDEKYARRDAVWLNRQVDAEDVDAMAQVRLGAQSRFAPRGRFAPGAEAGPHWFHRLVYQNVFETGAGA